MNNNYDELYHYGVKGMKWGVRRSNGASVNTSGKKSTAIDKTRDLADGYIGYKRKRNKRAYVQDQIGNVLKPGNPVEKHKTVKQTAKDYKADDRKLAYKQAKIKARKDPKYKESAEYKTAKREYEKQAAMDALERLMKAQRKDF